MSDLRNALLEESGVSNSHRHTPKPCGMPYKKKTEAVVAVKGGPIS